MHACSKCWMDLFCSSFLFLFESSQVVSKANILDDILENGMECNVWCDVMECVMWCDVMNSKTQHNRWQHKHRSKDDTVYCHKTITFIIIIIVNQSINRHHLIQHVIIHPWSEVTPRYSPVCYWLLFLWLETNTTHNATHPTWHTCTSTLYVASS